MTNKTSSALTWTASTQKITWDFADTKYINILIEQQVFPADRIKACSLSHFLKILVVAWIYRTQPGGVFEPSNAAINWRYLVHPACCPERFQSSGAASLSERFEALTLTVRMHGKSSFHNGWALKKMKRPLSSSSFIDIVIIVMTVFIIIVVIVMMVIIIIHCHHRHHPHQSAKGEGKMSLMMGGYLYTLTSITL